MPRVKIGPALPHREKLDVEIARLRDLDVGQLRSRWHTAFGRPAPAHLSRHLLFRSLAYRLQADRLGPTWRVIGASASASGRCRARNRSDFLLNNHTVDPRLFEPKVSVAGKRNFAGRDKRRRNGSEDQGDHCRDMPHASNPANSTLTCPELGILRLRGSAWWRSQSESNLSQQQLKSGDLAFDRRPKSPFISPPGRPGRCLK
jgi:hypothetical protein